MTKDDMFQLYFIDFDGRSDMTKNLGQYDTFEAAQLAALADALREEWFTRDSQGLSIARMMTDANEWPEEELGGFDATSTPRLFQLLWSCGGADWGYAIFKGRAALKSD